MGIENLYTPPSTPSQSGKYGDRAIVLKRIAKSLLLNFLELLGILSHNPEQVCFGVMTAVTNADDYSMTKKSKIYEHYLSISTILSTGIDHIKPENL
jgi:hypothetical protein